METAALHFETLQLHAGQEQPDPATGARAVPVYQTASYVFHNSQHAADRFGLRDAGNIYGRLTNPTQGVLEERMAALEGGTAALAVASGAAAVTYALQNLLRAGDHVVAADNLYGGSYNLITHTLAEQGISHTIVSVNDIEALEAAIRPETKAVFAETLGNPNTDVTDTITISWTVPQKKKSINTMTGLTRLSVSKSSNMAGLLSITMALGKQGQNT